ncbi:MlaD family protein [Paracoccaceae bacterium Fryx2]|nr:MlaD family protein [Paracoccaceae bacterium Fryx2]
METRANYVLIGAFTVFAMLAGLGFFLWLAKVQVDRTYTQYDILFDSVAGLAVAAPVRLNGVDVGEVRGIALDSSNSGRVRVRIEVAAATPVRQGTQATLASQGVTGVAFIGLEGGAADAPRYDIDPETGVALIPSKTTVVQGLIEDAPDLLREAISLLRDLGQFTGPENREKVANILTNVEVATGRLDEALTDLATTSDSFVTGVDQISSFATRLDGVAAKADTALVTANRTLQGLDSFTREGLPRITALSTEAGRLVAALASLTARIERDPARFLLGNRAPEYTR